MNDIAIRVENLGKLYRIGQTVGYKTLRESLMWVATTPLRRLRSTSHDPSAMSHQPNTIWALKDVSFEVKRGEAVGIIGRNGSGKTTLLKILSRITAPTEGYAEIHGRIGSLLEVGTGFHPELTGRENIYLNGAVIGMKKAEVERKFDEIVAFAEIEKFLDTPVKRYSSGMYVRLAFSVAAHLEPDILLVDEVLAVGDAQFQKKCLGKMGAEAQRGRTVLFVSHNMAAVQALCHTGIVLNSGRIDTVGPIGEAIHHYQDSLRRIETLSAGIQGVQVLAIGISTTSDALHFRPDKPLIAEMDFYTEYYLRNCYLNFVIEDAEGRYLVHFRTDLLGIYPTFERGLHRVRVEIPRLGLRAGIYTVWFRLYASNGEITEMADSERIMLEVSGPQVGGLVDVPCHWSWMPVEISSTRTPFPLG